MLLRFVFLTGSIIGSLVARRIDQSKNINSEHDDPGSIYKSTAMNNVQFFLWTRENPEKNDYYEMMNNDIENLKNSSFADYKRTYFIMHGFGGNGLQDFILNMKDEILKWSNCQIISIDYGATMSDSILPPRNWQKAIFLLYFVAEYVGSFIDFLTTSTALTTAQIHIIGYSLGGQGAGLVAKNVKTGLIDRISALDPAGWFFYNKSPKKRLDKSDAAFVDVIHANGCDGYFGCFGDFRPVGHVNFYPNGGKYQRGCLSFPWMFSPVCSHFLITEFWLESIKAPYDSNFTEEFWAYKCPDYKTYLNGSCTDQSTAVVMGFRATRDVEGSFFLDTRKTTPFAKGKIKT